MTPRTYLHVTHIDALVFVLPEREILRAEKTARMPFYVSNSSPFLPQKQARIHTHTYSNSSSLQYREPNPICLRRIHSGGGNLSAAKFYLLKTTLALHSLAVCLIFFLFFTSPSCCFCLLLCLLSCGFHASSARSIATNERGLYEGVSCFPSLEQEALI